MSVPAKPMNQVMGPPSSEPVWAVPVLPATETPATWAGVPVPLLTVSCIRLVRVAAVWESMGVRATVGLVVETTWRSASRVWEIRYGVICSPSLATVAATIAIMSGMVRTDC